MFKDNDGNDLAITQAVFDAVQLTDRDLPERFSGEEKIPVESVVGELVRYSREQIAHCISAIGNLESRMIALQQASGIDQIEFSKVDIRLVSNEDKSE